MRKPQHHLLPLISSRPLFLGEVLATDCASTTPSVRGAWFDHATGQSMGTQMSLLELTVEEIKIPSEMEIAPHYRLLSLMGTLLTWLTLLKRQRCLEWMGD